MKPLPRQDITENKMVLPGKYLISRVHSGQGLRSWFLELCSLCSDMENPVKHKGNVSKIKKTIQFIMKIYLSYHVGCSNVFLNVRLSTVKHKDNTYLQSFSKK